MSRVSIIALFSAIVLAACGEKLPLPTDVRDDDGGRLLDTTYAVVLPNWTGAGGIPFARPYGVSIGYDRSIYVCDTDHDRIVRLNVNGELLESFDTPHPIAVAQDRSFNLAAVGDSPEIWLRRFKEHGAFTTITHLDSNYICTDQPDGSVWCRWIVPRFEAIAASPLPTSQFLAVASGKVWGIYSDAPVLQIAIDTGVESGQVYNPTSVAMGIVSSEVRYIVAQYPSHLGVQYIGGRPRGPLLKDPATDVLNMTLDDTKYVALDEHGNVFVLHHEASFVMVFDKNGRYKLRFGSYGNGDEQMQYPRAIAVLDETVYIADPWNNRVLRFQSTTMPQN